METAEEKSISSLGFISTFKSKYAEVYKTKSDKAILCVIVADYIPIKEFKTIFGEISKVVKEDSLDKFIFDKRALRTFHQPSMEWYFLEWKTEMYNHGLKKHRKILPDLPWFVKSVEIARDPLIQKFPEGLFKKLDISYHNSIEEALEH